MDVSVAVITQTFYAYRIYIFSKKLCVVVVIALVGYDP